MELIAIVFATGMFWLGILFAATQLYSAMVNGYQYVRYDLDNRKK